MLILINDVNIALWPIGARRASFGGGYRFPSVVAPRHLTVDWPIPLGTHTTR